MNGTASFHIIMHLFLKHVSKHGYGSVLILKHARSDNNLPGLTCCNGISQKDVTFGRRQEDVVQQGVHVVDHLNGNGLEHVKKT